MESCPGFFKFFIATVNNKDMQLPIGYTKKMTEALPEEVRFKDRYNNIWAVNIEGAGNDWHFVGGGWVKFVEDNALESGDLLVFNYFHYGWFHVRTYGQSGNEKEGPGPIMSRSDEKAEKCLKDIKDNDHNDEKVTESEDYCIRIVREGRHDEGSDENGNDFDRESTGSDENVSPFIRRNNKLKRHHDDKDEEERDKVDVTTGVGSSGNVRGRSIDLTARSCGVEIFRAGLAEQPVNPYFVTKMLRSRKSDLFVPQNFVQSYYIDFTQEMSFVDPKGRTYGAKCRIWNDGRVVISGGWRPLCAMNLVDKDDLCICEFVQGEGRRLSIKVSFVRSSQLNG